MALVTLLDSRRQWFKSHIGVEITETPREIAFCAYTILQSDMMLVEDAGADARFATNPLVLAAPHLRFYAGVPLITSDGFALGTLCVLDRRPRTLTPEQSEMLRFLARQVVSEIELRRRAAELERALAERDQALTRWQQQTRRADEAMREAEAATRRKSEFVAHISHEIRTPLYAIMA